MSVRRSLFGLVLLGWALVGCQPAMPPAPLAKPDTIEVQLTPALRGLAPEMNACVRETSGVGIAVIEHPAKALDLKARGVALRWGAPAQVPGYAAVLGWDRLAFISAPGSPLRKLTLQQLRAIYSGAAAKSLPVKEVHSWEYNPEDDAQQVLALALGQDAKPGISGLAPNPEAMRQAVADDPAAIGFLPARYLDDSVQEIAIDGAAPDSLRQPILALSPSEPQGALRQWLGCLQAKLK